MKSIVSLSVWAALLGSQAPASARVDIVTNCQYGMKNAFYEDDKCSKASKYMGGTVEFSGQVAE